MTANGRRDVLKSLAYDLISVVEEQPDQTYTAEDVKHLIKTFVAGAESNENP